MNIDRLDRLMSNFNAVRNSFYAEKMETDEDGIGTLSIASTNTTSTSTISSMANTRSRPMPMVMETNANPQSQFVPIRPRPRLDLLPTESELVAGLQNFHARPPQGTKTNRKKMTTIEFMLLPGPRNSYSRAEVLKYTGIGKTHFYTKKAIKFERNRENLFVRIMVRAKFPPLSTVTEHDFDFSKLVSGQFHEIGIDNPTASEIAGYKIRGTDGKLGGGGRSKVWIMPKMELIPTDLSSASPTHPAGMTPSEATEQTASGAPRTATSTLMSPTGRTASRAPRSATSTLMSPPGATGRTASRAPRSATSTLMSPPGATGRTASRAPRSATSTLMSPSAATGRTASRAPRSATSTLMSPPGATGRTASRAPSSATSTLMSPSAATGRTASRAPRSATSTLMSPPGATGRTASRAPSSATSTLMSPPELTGRTASRAPRSVSASLTLMSPQDATRQTASQAPHTSTSPGMTPLEVPRTATLTLMSPPGATVMTPSGAPYTANIGGASSSSGISHAVSETSLHHQTIPSPAYVTIDDENQYDYFHEEPITDMSQEEEPEESTQEEPITDMSQEEAPEVSTQDNADIQTQEQAHMETHQQSVQSNDNDAVMFRNLQEHLNYLKTKSHAKDYVKSSYSGRESSIPDLLRALQMERGIGRSNCINIVKSNALKHLMEQIMLPTFKEDRLLDVKFEGELGVDNGALTASLLELIKEQLHQLPIFLSSEDGLRLRLNKTAYDNNMYEAAGRVLAYMTALGGVLPQVMSPFLYSLVAYGPRRVWPKLHDISEVRDQLGLYKIWRCEPGSLEEQNARVEFCQTITMAGCDDIKNNKDLVESLIKFLAVDVQRNAIEQFIDGLQWCGVGETISKNPSRMEELFVYKRLDLSAEVLEKLFKVNYSQDKGKKKLEKKVMEDFKIFMKDMEVEGILEQLLQFATAKKFIPVLGFEPQLSIEFRHPEGVPLIDSMSRDFPKASACAHQLILPTGHKTTRAFLTIMHQIITTHYDKFDDY